MSNKVFVTLLGFFISTPLIYPLQSDVVQAPEPLRVPAFTAYIEPDPEAMEVSEQNGISGWKDTKEEIVWYGNMRSVGRLHVSVSLRLPIRTRSSYRLTVEGRSHTAKAVGNRGDKPITLDFGMVTIPSPGYYRFVLKGLSKTGQIFGKPEALLLDGPAAVDAQFNLTERRNAASVHLFYPTPTDAKIEWFYNEVTVRTDPLWSYYMACGFQRGYFGIQVNSPTERRIIFSVWDSGKEAVDRSKVADSDRVQLVAKGEGVFADSFGNEGTGGHSHLVYPWKTGDAYRFLIAAKPEGTDTIYSGYFYFPEKQRWGLIASFRAPKDGGYLHGLYSFNEDFAGANGQKRRVAEFGNQWVKTAGGEWSALRTARFSHDSHGGQNRKDYSAGVVNGRFYLSNGGYVSGPAIRFGAIITRPLSDSPPTDIVLP